MNPPPVPTSLPCNLVNNLSYSVEQCKFIIDNDCLEEESMIDYVYLVYCELGIELRLLSISLIVLLVIVLFLALSAVADEFLCPSTLTVAKKLRMSDSLAGVTLLAFGNGCPDIFSSIAAASSDRSELIVGELLGAGIFCTSIVSGMIFIHSDFKLASRPLLRDTTFYLLAVYLIWYYCWEGEVTFYESLAFIVIYMVYLVVALVGQAVNSRLRGNYPIAEAQVVGQPPAEPRKSENWFRWREESFRRKMAAKKEKEMETTFLTNNRRIRCHSGGDTRPKLSVVEMKQYPIYTLRSSSVPLNLSLSGKRESGRGFLNQSFVPGPGEEHQPSGKTAKVSPVTSSGKEKQHSSAPGFPALKMDVEMAKQMEAEAIDSSQFCLNQWDDFFNHINPIDLASWYESNLCGKLVSILRAPLLFVSILTVPVVDLDRRNNNWCRLLNSLHALTIPLIVALNIQPSSGDDTFIWFLAMPLPVLVSIPGALLALTILNTSTNDKPPRYHGLFAFIGFFMSIAWIYMLATEIISLLKTVGVIFSMSDTAIGLGILAWGNSLGDIVANMSLAEAGYPRMALGASIGAPLLNLLLGFGLSFSINLRPGQFSTIEYSPTITLLCSTLILILVALMFSTLAPPNKSKKSFGYLLIATYFVYLGLAVLLEYKIIKF